MGLFWAMGGIKVVWSPEQQRWVPVPVSEFAAPVPGEPESVEDKLARRYADEDPTAERWQKLHEQLVDLYGVVWHEEEWAATEDHIDQQVANRARIDAYNERRRRQQQEHREQ